MKKIFIEEIEKKEEERFAKEARLWDERKIDPRSNEFIDCSDELPLKNKKITILKLNNNLNFNEDIKKGIKMLAGCHSQKEIEKLLIETLLWISEMEDYPEELRTIITEEINEEVSSNESKLQNIPERIVIQTLRWVLGKI
jgi:hypothetical protein